MKIKLKDLKPNPFKQSINGGLLTKSKIEMLKESIRKDGFWNNILCRKKNGNYELAYGHHRVEAAIQVLGASYTIDVPCEKLSDEAMLRILGNENSMQNEEYAIYQVDQVLATQKFLKENPSLSTGKKSGHGAQPDSAPAISKFLGEKNWSLSKVASLLKLHKELHPKILRELRNTPGVTRDKEISAAHGITISRLKDKKDQLRVYDAVKKLHLNKYQTSDMVTSIKDNKNTAITHSRYPPSLERVAVDVAKKINGLLPLLKNLIPLRKNMNKGTRLLLDNCLNRCRKTIDDYFKQEVK